MALPRRFVAPLRHVTTVVFGPEPVGAYTAAEVDDAFTRELSGRTARSLRFGEKATPAKRFYGDLGPQQTFRGMPPSSRRQTNLRGSGDGRAFPSTKPTVSVAQAALENAYGPYGTG